MIYFVGFGVLIGIIICIISERPSKEELKRRAEVKIARDNFYLREEEKHRASKE